MSKNQKAVPVRGDHVPKAGKKSGGKRVSTEGFSKGDQRTLEWLDTQIFCNDGFSRSLQHQLQTTGKGHLIPEGFRIEREYEQQRLETEAMQAKDRQEATLFVALEDLVTMTHVGKKVTASWMK